MKKILIIICIFTISITNAQSKNSKKNSDKKARFGLIAGLNIANANLSGDGVPSTKSITDFHGGAFVDIEINEKFHIQPELIYSGQGTKFDLIINYEGTNYNTTDEFRLSYINLPIMFKFYPQKSFYLAAGPQIGFLTKSTLKVSVLGQSAEQDAKDLFTGTDMGINIGTGYEFTDNFFANAQYNIGLSNIAETEPGDNSKIKNRVFQLSIGYKF